MDYMRWQKKMNFFLTSISVMYVLSTPIPDSGDDAIVESIRKKRKWENDDYVCRGLLLNETKYMAKDAYSKKFLVSNLNNYKMVDSGIVIEQYNELLRILVQSTKHKKNMDEAISLSCVNDKLLLSCK
ncbi:hypothetical protein Tco_0903249 [Tanacetum coccineum]